MESKSQHFLISARATTLSIKRIHRLSDDEAFAEFVAIRFASSGGRPKCVWCGNEECQFISTRKKWRCKNRSCARQFSATSQTIFASRKLGYRDILLGIAHMVNAAKNISSIRLRQEMEVSYKTAFVFSHKVREVMTQVQQRNVLKGDVEIDGAYFGGYVKPRNDKPSRRDRRLLAHRTGKRKCVVIFRERGGRSRPVVCSESEAAQCASQIIEEGSRVYTDDAKQFTRLNARYEVFSVNHSLVYADGQKSVNWAEAYFSRLRRAEMETHHHIAGAYFAAYANEVSWREDNRGRSNGENFQSLSLQLLRHPISRQWKGYWQRRRQQAG